MEHSDYPAPHDAWRAQKPAAGRLTLDHCAHFVPDIERASAALARLGFTLTPFSAQHHRMTPSEPLVPAGTGNRCIMLRRGYLEFLTPTADTPIAGRLRAAIHRYTGPHLVCFGVADAGAAHAHLASEGFDPLPVVALERQIGTPAGEDTARFAVVRTPPDKMPEGRIQFVEHRTPELLWQERWLAHANRAVGLDAAILCVANPAAVAARYARFTGLPTEKHDGAWRLATAHGALLFLDPDDCARRFGVAPPVMPWIAAVVLTCADLAAARDHLARAAVVPIDAGRDRIAVIAPPEIGGIFMFRPPDAGPFLFE